jgi:hypothetical protein
MRQVFRHLGVLALALPSITCVANRADTPTLIGFASLPADSFAPGPTSGQFIAAANGVTPPFINRQPVQGFSSVLRASNGEFLAMVDNGFGSRQNSPDHVLRVYRVAPDFKTRNGGSGSVRVQSHIQLSDPNRLVPFPIVAAGEFYPGTPANIPVDPAIKSARLLTGWDFDIESVREAHDGTLWFGDEFGPFLLHTDASGRLLDPPISLPGVQSPQNPLGGTANLARSRGFEGVAISPDGKVLYPMLEGPVAGDDPRLLRIHEFDLLKKQYTGRRWSYVLDAAEFSNGDFTAVTDRLFLVIERDDNQGDAAAFKKIFLVDLDVTTAAGALVKFPVVDLLKLADPDHLAAQSGTFRFPFQTIEAVAPLSQTELLVLNDNNYPFGNGRNPSQPDPNEWILIRLDRPLPQYRR